MRILNTLKSALPLLALTALSATAAFGQAAPSLVQTRAQYVGYTGLLAPGTTGGETLGAPIQAGSSVNPPNPFDGPVIDNDGYVVMRGRMIGGGVVATTERAIFRGRDATDLQMVIRAGDQAPTLTTGITLNTATAQGLGGSPRTSNNGVLMFGSSMSGAAFGVTTANDTALFGGTPGNLIPFIREGDPAPGTVGATIGASLNNLSHQSTGCNENGAILFQSSTIGGDTVGTTNNAAWFSGVPGNIQIVQRKGDVVLGGAVISALGFVSQMNSQNQVLHDETLSTTLGTTPATAANDKALFVWTPGVGNALVVREGDPAPGTVGATFNLASNSWFINTGANTFNNNGNTFLNCDLLGGDVVGTTNNGALYLGGTGGLTMVVRKGDVAPGTGGAVFSVFSNQSLNLNNSDIVAFEGVLVQGGAITAANDTGIWIGQPGNLTKIMQEGDPAPGTAGAVFDNQSGLFMIMNDKNQIVFSAGLLGGDVNISLGNFTATYCWDPIVGLQLVARGGDVLTLPNGQTRTIGSFGSGIQFNNGGGNPLSLNANGDMCSSVGFTTVSGGGGAIVKIHLGSFSCFRHDISVATGDTQTMYMDAGPANANNIYVVLGSVSGSVPGFGYNQFTIPLNQDFYFQYTIQLANIPPLINTLGTLDANGRGIAAFQMPLGFPQLAGFVLTHAFVAVNPGSGQVTFVSEPQDMLLVP